MRGVRAFFSGGVRSRSFFWLTALFLVLLCLMSVVACSFGYMQKKGDFVANRNTAIAQLLQEYTGAYNNFWQIYMPAVEEDQAEALMHAYFSQNDALTPHVKGQLIALMAKMALRDSRVRWIALLADDREENYVYYIDRNDLQPIPEDFPFLSRVANKTTQMEVYGAQKVISPYGALRTFAFCGGSPVHRGGHVMVGYSVDSFEKIISTVPNPANSRFFVVSSGEVLFDSSGAYTLNGICVPDAPVSGRVDVPGAQSLYVDADIGAASVFSTALWTDARAYFHAYTGTIVLAVLIISFLALALYTYILYIIGRELRIIRNGLYQLGENQLDFRLPTSFRKTELGEVAQAINRMAGRLQENINRAYTYAIRQREAEMSELQSKFNPHFLYNTLNMLSTRCYQHGDPGTADLIIQLAGIFRGLLSARTFIPFREELAFSKRYLALFCARYENRVQIRYDIDSRALRFGVIRNIFQPLIENYFVHGFDDSAEENYILFSGRCVEPDKLEIVIQDNGIGMDEAHLRELNASFREPVAIDTESYGLKNLYQRLCLFYGQTGSLTVEPNGERGLCVRMTLLQMTVEEYESRQGASPGAR